MVLAGVGVVVTIVLFSDVPSNQIDQAGDIFTEVDVESDLARYVVLEPFVVSLADAGGSRFLRVSMTLELNTPEQAASFERNPVEIMRVRSTILGVLGEQKADELLTSEAKERLKQRIIDTTAVALEGFSARSVNFSEFVVQF